MMEACAQFQHETVKKREFSSMCYMTATCAQFTHETKKTIKNEAKSNVSYSHV